MTFSKSPHVRGAGTLLSSLLAALLLAACGAADATLSMEGPFGDEEGNGFEEENLSEQALAACTPLNTSGPIYAFGGTVLTPTKALDGYLVVQGERILDVVARGGVLPEGAQVMETNGVIAPGFFDLHNHVAYNFLPVWTPPALYQNRYQWQSASAYGTAVRTPYNKVRAAGHLCEAQKYGELRALVGGTTAIQGSLGYACQNGWARNVEGLNFCEDHVRQFTLAISGLSSTDAAVLREQFDSQKTRAFIVHLGEGVDQLSRDELTTLDGLGLRRKEVVAIHGTAFGAEELASVGAAGMGLVWSPRSNLALYGKTLDVAAAKRAGVRIALAPDWSPSGSANLLAELKLADQLNQTQFGGVLSNVDLVRMATQVPAELAGLGDKLGKLAPGYVADFMVLRRHAGERSHYRVVIDALPQDVLLTAVAGSAWYGDPMYLDAMGRGGQYETVDACGASRGLVVKNPGVTFGNESLQDVLATFAADGVSKVAPLFECAQ